MIGGDDRQVFGSRSRLGLKAVVDGRLNRKGAVQYLEVADLPQVVGMIGRGKL